MAKYPGRKLVLTVTASDTTVGQLVTMGEAGSSRGLIDASVYGDEWKDYVTDQQDGDEMPIEVAYDPSDTGILAVKAAYDAGTSEHFEMVHVASGFHVGFPALVTKFARGGARDGLLHALATLKILNPGVEDVGSS